jgi:hypothetical protein
VVPGSEIPYDALVTLFVFLIGVPAVVLQTLPPETRQFVSKRPAQLVVDAVIPSAMALAVLSAGVAARRVGWAEGDSTWALVLGGSLLIGVLAALHVARKYGRRDAVVRRLEREAAAELDRGGRLAEDPLHDLVEFGRRSEPGRARQWVLESLLGLTSQTCSHPRYSGDGLEDLITGVVEILLAGSGEPNPQNMAVATALLRIPMRALDHADQEAFKQADALHAMYAANRLGRSALRLENDASVLRMVQGVGVTGRRHPSTSIAASQVLFELGVAALERDKPLVAVAALGHLSNLVEENAPAGGELVADTLGLLAHFWADGETGCRFARERLERLEPRLADDLPRALAATAEHSARRTLFRTADRVREVERAVRASRAAAETPGG